MRDIMINENQLTFLGILQNSRNDAQRNSEKTIFKGRKEF